MSEFDGLLNMIPIGEIAKQLGINEDVAESAVKQVIPAIIGGMAANAKDSNGAASLEKALVSHADKLPKSVADIDTADGEKIVNNVFGAKKNEVVAAVADTNGNATQEIIAKILPIVAPIVISFIASQFLGGKKDAPAETAAAEPAASGGGIGDLLGGLLGSQGGQDLVGGLLGGLLGGGKK